MLTRISETIKLVDDHMMDCQLSRDPCEFLHEARMHLYKNADYDLRDIAAQTIMRQCSIAAWQEMHNGR